MNDDQNNDHDHSSDPWGDEMTSEFDRRVRDLHEAPLSLDQVKGKAMNIQHKRRAAVAGGILAAAAVIVPVAVVAGGGFGNDKASDPPIATSGATATDTASPSPAPVPALASYVEGDEFHRPDGSVSSLPSSAYEGAVLLGDRVLAQRRDDQGVVTVDVVEDDAVVETFDAGTGLTTSAAQDLAGLVTPAGEIHLFWVGGDRVLADGFRGHRIRGLVGGSNCAAAGAGDGSTCRVALSDDGTSTQDPVVLDGTGADAESMAGAVQVNDVGVGDRSLTLESRDDDGSCGSLREGTRKVFETCDHTLVQLSPAGDLVLAYPAYLSGFGPFTMSILDAATGDALAEVSSDDRSALSQAAWVDDDTIAFTTLDFGAQQWSLSTLTAGDTEPTPVAGPGPGDDATPAFGILGR